MTALPALADGHVATPGAAAIVAHDDWFQDAASADVSDASVTVSAGGAVTFSYPAGANSHNVKFDDPQPACELTKEVPDTVPLPVPPLPGYPQPAGWEGTCTFAAAGTYSFVCQAHPDMHGTVVVEPSDEPTPSPSPTATATPSPTPPPAPAFETHDNAFQSTSGGNSITIEPGTTVGFSYLQGASAHNVRFAPLQPAECRQTAGPAIGAVPPLPPAALGPGWVGECRFDAPGDYTFVCSVHSEMTGTVVVRAPDAVQAVATPEPVVRDATPAPVPRPWARVDRVKLKRGKLTVTARCLSAGKGKVTLTVSKRVARRLKLHGRTLATAAARCDGHGRMKVTVRLKKPVRRALARRHRVKVTATLKLGGHRADRRRLSLKVK
jgi:plastocyanin